MTGHSQSSQAYAPKQEFIKGERFPLQSPIPWRPGPQSLHRSFPAAHLSHSLLLSSRSCPRTQLSQHLCASPESRSMQHVICQAAFGKHSSLSATEHPEQSSLSPWCHPSPSCHLHTFNTNKCLWKSKEKCELKNCSAEPAPPISIPVLALVYCC